MKYKITPAPAATTVSLAGDLMETTRKELDELLAAIPRDAKTVVLDCRRIGAMNSIGLRDWVLFLKKLTSGRAVELVDVPASFVGYVLMAPVAKGDAAISSFEVGLNCVSCKRIASVFVKTKDLGPDRRLDAVVCPHCGSKTEPMLHRDEVETLLA